MERNTPPKSDADLLKQEMRKLLDELVQMIFDDPAAPADLKMALQIGEAGKRICDKVQSTAFQSGLEIKPGCSDEVRASGKQLLEYLQLMEAGFDTFLDALKKQ